jgi:hypothetical protein
MNCLWKGCLVTLNELPGSDPLLHFYDYQETLDLLKEILNEKRISVSDLIDACK